MSEEENTIKEKLDELRECLEYGLDYKEYISVVNAFDYIEKILEKQQKVIEEYKKECRMFRGFCRRLRNDNIGPDEFNQGREYAYIQFLNLIAGEENWEFEGKYFDEVDKECEIVSKNQVKGEKE